MATLIPYSSPRQQFFDASGRPLAGGKIYTYTAGTTTPSGTWADASGTIPNTNPIILDAAGAATIFFNAANFYKVVVQNSLGVLQWMIDHLNPCACGGGGGVTPPPPGAVSLLSISVSPPWILGAESATGTVTLSGPAPDGGAVVALVSSNFDIAQPGASVTVPAGDVSATFPINTSGVNIDVSVSITGAYGGGSASTTLIVGAPTDVVLVSITLNPTSVRAGDSVTGTATMSGHTLGSGALVALKSSDSSIAQVPTGGVEVIAGMTTAEFTVTTTASTSAATATITGHYGNDESATLIVTPGSGIILVSITLSSGAVAGGESLVGTVTLSGGAPAGGAVVSLESSNIYLVTVPGTVTVPAGQSSATFTITTSSSIGSDNYPVAITATYAGHSKGVTFLLSRPSVHAVWAGLGPPNQTGAALAGGGEVVLDPSMYPLGQAKNAAEVVGDSWQFTPNGQNIYLVLVGGSRTFVDQNNNNFSMNPPIAVTIGAYDMYLYGSARSLYGSWTVRIQS